MNGSRSSDDKVFQAAGPDVENARGPNVDVSVLGTTSWLSSADRSRDRPKTEEVGTQSLVSKRGSNEKYVKISVPRIHTPELYSATWY